MRIAAPSGNGPLPAVVAALAVAPAAGGCTDAPGRGGLDNALVVTVDTLRADRVDAHGGARGLSPRLDAFAEEAWVFDRAYSTSSWTLPALASLMTSLHPATHGCLSNKARLSPAAETLAETLASAGFVTGAITSHVFLHPRYRLDQGFAHYDSSLVQDDFDGSHESITSERVADKAIDWLDARAQAADGARWLLWLHFFDPHATYFGHRGFAFELDEPRRGSVPTRYDSEVAWTDHHVGRVLDRLRELGFDRSTLVLVTADHGEELGEHGNTGHRLTLFEEVVRVPFLLRVPGRDAGRSSVPISLVDVVPTLCELLRVRAPAGMQGTSLVALLGGDPRAARPPVFLQLGNDRLTAVVTERWKLLHSTRTRGAALYDLDADPLEREDVAARFPVETADLSARREQRLEALRAAGAPYASTDESTDADPLSERQVDALRALGYVEDE